MKTEFTSFSEFYSFYLSEHQNRICRRLHFVGSSLVLLIVVFVLVTAKWQFLLLALVAGYGFAWLGHFFFEKNRPATFTHPLYSFLGDWVMYKDMLMGKLKF